MAETTGKNIPGGGGALCDDDILVVFNFTRKWVGGDILDELDVHCKTQHKSRLHLAMVR